MNGFLHTKNITIVRIANPDELMLIRSLGILYFKIWNLFVF